jgi:hypothetical protein
MVAWVKEEMWVGWREDDEGEEQGETCWEEREVEAKKGKRMRRAKRRKTRRRKRMITAARPSFNCCELA